MAGNDLDYRAIRSRAEERLKRDKRLMRWIFFVVYLVMYIAFLIIAWGLYLSNGGSPPQPNIPGVPNDNNPIAAAMTLLSVIGGVGVLFQFIAAMVDTKAGESQMRERAYGRELADELARLGTEGEGTHEKAKGMMRLSEDGELEEIVEDEAVGEAERRGKRRS